MNNFVGGVVEVAIRLREMGRQFTPPFSVTAILLAAFPNASVIEDDLPEGIEEVVAVEDDRPLVIYRRGLVQAERRFAAAHALAHLAFDLHRPQALIDEDREHTADVFALELLAPRALLARETLLDIAGFAPLARLARIDEIAAAFHVPPFVIDQRIRQLNRLAT